MMRSRVKEVMTTKFNFEDKEFKIDIKWKTASEVLPDKFDIELLKIFVNDQAATAAMQRMLLDDMLAHKVMWFFMESQTAMTYDQYEDKMSIPALDVFREAFWIEVSNFFGSAKRKLVLDMWEMFKKELKNADLQMLISENLSSNSPPEPA